MKLTERDFDRLLELLENPPKPNKILIRALANFVDDYKGSHEAPGKESAPLNDLTLNGIYPVDVYTHPHYYDIKFPIADYRNKPNKTIKIYRAVPKILSNEDQIKEFEKQLAYIQKHGKVPRYVDTSLDRSAYYGKISDEIERLEKLPSENVTKPKINKGDWVTIDLAYAKEHGQSHLNNQYKVITKTVKAKDIYTDGNSIMEWGYYP